MLCFLQTNLFFGEVEGAVMNKLLLMGSFKKWATKKILTIVSELDKCLIFM